MVTVNIPRWPHANRTRLVWRWGCCNGPKEMATTCCRVSRQGPEDLTAKSVSNHWKDRPACLDEISQVPCFIAVNHCDVSGSGRPRVWERNETWSCESPAAGTDLCLYHHRGLWQPAAQVLHGSPGGVVVVLLHDWLRRRVSYWLVWE